MNHPTIKDIVLAMVEAELRATQNAEEHAALFDALRELTQALKEVTGDVIVSAEPVGAIDAVVRFARHGSRMIEDEEGPYCLWADHVRAYSVADTDADRQAAATGPGSPYPTHGASSKRRTEQ